MQTALYAQGVFVGEDTLEIDLLDQFSDEMKETYSELRNSEKASEKFDAAVDGASSDACIVPTKDAGNVSSKGGSRLRAIYLTSPDGLDVLGGI